MKKIVRLTESDLVKLVKRVIAEQNVPGNPPIITANPPSSVFKGPYMSQMEGEMLLKKFPQFLRQVFINDRIAQQNITKTEPTQAYRVAYQVIKDFFIDGVNLPVNSFLNTCDSRTGQCENQIKKAVNVKMGGGDAAEQYIKLI